MFSKIQKPMHAFWRALARRSVLIPIIGAITVISITTSVTALNTFIVYDGDQVAILNSKASSTRQALEEMGVVIGELDKVDMPETAINGVAKIQIIRAADVTVSADGQTQTMRAGADETVGEVLARAGIALSAQDQVSPAADTAVEDGMNIAVTRLVSYQTEQLVDIPFSKVSKQSATLEKGKQVVVQQGASGQKKQVYRVIVQNGEVTSRTLLREEVIREATPQIVQTGTKVNSNTASFSGSGTLTSRGGAPLRYKRKLTVTATAYTTERWKNKTTATGAIARVGLIAVDPRVIPLGTRMYITSMDGKSWIYGTAVAADTGGGIKGNRIDLFFNTYNECIQFGRRKAIVYILE